MKSFPRMLSAFLTRLVFIKCFLFLSHNNQNNGPKKQVQEKCCYSIIFCFINDMLEFVKYLSTYFSLQIGTVHIIALILSNSSYYLIILNSTLIKLTKLRITIHSLFFMFMLVFRFPQILEDLTNIDELILI
jgi:hypothetical protein